MYVHFIVHIHVSVFFIRLRFEDGRLQETPDSVSAVCRYSIQCKCAITHAYFQCISFFPGLQIIKNRLAYKLNHGLSNFTGLLPAVRSQGKFSHDKIALQTSCVVLTCLLKIIFQMKT